MGDEEGFMHGRHFVCPTHQVGEGREEEELGGGEAGVFLERRQQQHNRMRKLMGGAGRN